VCVNVYGVWHSQTDKYAVAVASAPCIYMHVYIYVYTYTCIYVYSCTFKFTVTLACAHMNMQLPLPLLLYPTRPSKFQILDIQRTKGYSIAMKSSCGRLGVYVCVRVRVSRLCVSARACINGVELGCSSKPYRKTGTVTKQDTTVASREIETGK